MFCVPRPAPGSRSNSIQAAKAEAQSSPSWRQIALEGEYEGLDKKASGIRGILIYCLHSTKIVNCALKDRLDRSRQVGSQQKMLTCRQGETAPFASLQIHSLPQMLMHTLGSVSVVKYLRCNPITECKTGSSPFIALLLIKTSFKPP